MWRDHFPRIFNNPIIQRESTVRLRMLSSFLFLGAVLSLGYLLMLANLQAINTFSNYQYMDRDDYIRSMFSQFNVMLFLGISAMIPFISAGAINHEKERETWDLVATTPLNYLTIYAGKFISSIWFVWLIFFSIMPFYGIYFLAGGISFGEVFVIFAGLTEVTIMLAALGLLCSCIYKRTVHSVTAAFVFGLLYLIIIPYTWLLVNAFNRAGMPIFDIVGIVSPLFFMFLFLSGGSGMPPMIMDKNTIILLHFLLNGTLFCLFAGFSIYLIYRKADHKPREILSDKNLNLNIKQVSTFMERFAPKPGFPDQQNPVMVKDIRMMICNRWSYIPYLGIMLLAFFIAAMHFVVYTQNPYPNFYDDVLLWLVFTPVLILPYAANCFRMEKDQDTFDLLRTTNLTGDQIVRGKWIAGFIIFMMRYSVFWIVSVTASLIFLVTDQGLNINQSWGISAQEYKSFYPMHLLLASLFPVISAVFFLTLGMFFSTVMRNTNAAYALTFLTAFGYFFGFMIVTSIMRSIVFQNMDYNFYRNLYSLFSPLWFMANLVYRDHNSFMHISAFNCFQIQSFLMIYASIIFYYVTIIALNKRNQ